MTTSIIVGISAGSFQGSPAYVYNRVNHQTGVDPIPVPQGSILSGNSEGTLTGRLSDGRTVKLPLIPKSVSELDRMTDIVARQFNECNTPCVAVPFGKEIVYTVAKEGSNYVPVTLKIEDGNLSEKGRGTAFSSFRVAAEASLRGSIFSKKGVFVPYFFIPKSE